MDKERFVAATVSLESARGQDDGQINACHKEEEEEATH